MMRNILDEIVANKRLEVAEQKKAIALSELQKDERLARPRVSMRGSLEQSKSGIIAEFKRKSPSKGWLFPDAKIANIIPAYEKANASACSVLTDTNYFGGSLDDLREARQLANIPLLRKDFIVDPYQIYQAKIAGADAILLIAAYITIEECTAWAKLAHELDLEVLLEVHNEKELGHLNEFVDILGVNNRNLETFHTDIDVSFQLIEKMKQQAAKTGFSSLMISESGISNPALISRLREVGFQGFLIGETFMRQENPGTGLANFINEIGC